MTIQPTGSSHLAGPSDPSSQASQQLPVALEAIAAAAAPLDQYASARSSIEGAGRVQDYTFLAPYLSNTASIPYNFRWQRAMQVALSSGHLPIVRLLMERTDSAALHLPRCHFEAIVQGHLSIVQYLTSRPGVDPALISRGLERAVLQGNNELVSYLIEQPGIDPHLLIAQLSTALMNRRSDISMALLSRIPAGDYHATVGDRIFSRHQHIYTAARNRMHDVLTLLLQRGPIPRNVFVSAMAQTSDERSRDILMASIPPAAPAAAAAAAPLAGAPGVEFELSLDDVKGRPLHWLQEIRDRGFPARIRLIGSPAIDAGGVKKQFLTTLMDGLEAQRCFTRTSSGVLSCTADQQPRLALLGRLYSEVDAANDGRLDMLLTGPFIHPRFLELARIDQSGATDEVKLREAARLVGEMIPEMRLLADIVDPRADATPEAQQERRQQFMDIYGCEPDAVDAEAADMIREYLRAASAFYEGAHAPFRDRMLAGPVGALEAVQGQAITKELLLGALTTDGAPSAALTQRVEWIRQLIYADTEDLPFCRRFVRCITGKSVLTAADRIRLRLAGAATTIFEVHTCFNSLDLPGAALTEAQFKEGLHNILADDSYNTR